MIELIKSGALIIRGFPIRVYNLFNLDEKYLSSLRAAYRMGKFDKLKELVLSPNIKSAITETGLMKRYILILYKSSRYFDSKKYLTKRLLTKQISRITVLAKNQIDCYVNPELTQVKKIDYIKDSELVDSIQEFIVSGENYKPFADLYYDSDIISSISVLATVWIKEG